MSRTQIILLHVSTIMVTITGVVFAWMKYGMHTDDPFAVANHPWQPFLLDLHVIFAPLLVFALGWIFGDHILLKYRLSAQRKRRSGLSAMWLIAPMIMTGYLIQVITNESLQYGSRIGHWVTSGIFVVAYAVHQYLEE
ncbi:MAG TPA: hypothetical protein VHL58_17980 [Thermoanaerobaculia bacterium]|nr:hypothetical protein [Thermoanaerobaculia bacterium]